MLTGDRVRLRAIEPSDAEMLWRWGFVEEGRMREAFWRDGNWHDYILMGLLAGGAAAAPLFPSAARFFLRSTPGAAGEAARSSCPYPG